MRECLMKRAAYEQVVFQVNENVVVFIASKWRDTRFGQEVFATAQEARDRYEAMKMIAAVDYHFHLFIENIDGE